MKLDVLFSPGLIEDDQKLRVYSWHEWIGVTIFLATIARLFDSGRGDAGTCRVPAGSRATMAR